MDRPWFARSAWITLTVALVGLLLVFGGVWLIRDGTARYTAPPCNGHTACLTEGPSPEVLLGIWTFLAGLVVLAAATPIIGGVSFVRAWRRREV